MVRKSLLFVGLLLTALTVGCGPSSEKQPVKVGATASPIPAPVVMRFHRQGGIAGLCDDVAIHADGVIEYHTCNRPTQTATLTQGEREELAGWVGELSAFTFKQEDNPGGPDNLVRELQFAGKGTSSATDEQKQMMTDWIERIYSELAQQPQPGSPVSTAGRVLDIMEQQVIVIRPDEPGPDLIAITPQTQFKLADGGSASLADLRIGMHIQVQGKAVGAGGLQADTVIIEPEQ